MYGANRSLLTIIEYLKNKGYDVSLMLPRYGEICEELMQKGISFKVVRCFTQLYYYKPVAKYLALPLLDILTFIKLPIIKKYVKKLNPDLIYSNTSAENIGIKIARSLGVKHISHIREFMDLDHGAKFLFGAKAKREYINQSDGVIYVSKAVASHVNLGCPLEKWQRVIYNGVKANDKSFVPRSLSGNLDLGVVGIFDKEKGQDLAIRILNKIIKEIPNVKLHLWGDKEGAYKTYLLNLTDKFGLKQNVVFHGFEKDPEKIYRDMNILLMCSRCEGFGRVTIEAMQRGIPVLGYRKGGTIELIKEGYNGFLFENESQCVSKLKILIQSQDFYDKVGEQAYKYSRDNFSERLYCSNVENFIKEIMNNNLK